MRKGVGKVRHSQFVKNIFLKRLIQAEQLAFHVLAALAAQFVVQKFFQDSAAKRERFRQRFRFADAFGRKREKPAQQGFDRCDALRIEFGLFLVNLRKLAERFPLKIVVVQPDPFEIVRDQNIVGKLPVFFDLVGFDDFIKRLADFFVFDIADNIFNARDFEIRCAEFPFTLAFMQNGDVRVNRRSDCRQQIFQLRTQRMFGNFRKIRGLQRMKVGGEMFHIF